MELIARRFLPARIGGIASFWILEGVRIERDKRVLIIGGDKPSCWKLAFGSTGWVIVLIATVEVLLAGFEVVVDLVGSLVCLFRFPKRDAIFKLFGDVFYLPGEKREEEKGFYVSKMCLLRVMATV